MTSRVVYPFGSTTITIPAGESIAVYTADVANVIRNLGFPNAPSQPSLLGQVSNTQTVFGSYSSGASITIEAGAAPVLYEVGTTPVVACCYATQRQPSPVAVNATGAVSTTALLGGIVTSTTAAAVAGTIPTGAAMDLASEFAVDDSFDWSVINTGANTFTVTAASGHTIVGAAAVATATSGYFRTRKTAADTFVTYRMS